MEWIIEGLQDLRHFLIENNVKSIAIPPLGAGNGGLDWAEVRPQIEVALSGLDTEILIFEPTSKYQNVAKRTRCRKADAGPCLDRGTGSPLLDPGHGMQPIGNPETGMVSGAQRRTCGFTPLDLRFVPAKYGPYADRLRHLLEGLDGSYLHCHKRIGDADPLDVIWFDDGRKAFVQTYLKSEAKEYVPALEATADLIDGFESPYGMELLATVDWLLAKEGVAPDDSRPAQRPAPLARRPRYGSAKGQTVRRPRLTHCAGTVDTESRSAGGLKVRNPCRRRGPGGCLGRGWHTMPSVPPVGGMQYVFRAG